MSRWMSVLQTIGEELDQGKSPRVGDSGIVMSSEAPALSTFTNEDQNYDNSRPRRSEAESGEGPTRGQGTSRGQGATRRQGSTNTAASVVSSDVSAKYEAELDLVQAAYPGTQIWRQDCGFWLRTEALLLTGLQQKAVFLTGISPQKNAVKSWAFWSYGCIGYQWIGPRHTNFPDGSVCAFEPLDGTWVMGEPLVALFDLYSLWALRHLYLQQFGRWPGPQALAHPYERIMELREDELCGCGTYHKRYGECCSQKDQSLNKISVAVNFLAQVNPEREPPSIIVASICNHTTPPQLNTFFEEVGYRPTTSGGIDLQVRAGIN